MPTYIANGNCLRHLLLHVQAVKRLGGFLFIGRHLKPIVVVPGHSVRSSDDTGKSFNMVANG